MERTYRLEYKRTCPHCEKDFQAWNKSAKYCSPRCRTDAATQRRDRAPNAWQTTPRKCRHCGNEFLPQSPNRRYCSLRCQAEGRNRDFETFKANNPGVQSIYNKTRKGDTLIIRVRKKFPDLTTQCEAVDCDESRVLDIAHKPEFKRNGAWRKMELYERHMFWMLCPTCHRVIDSGIQTPEELGLS